MILEDGFSFATNSFVSASTPDGTCATLSTPFYLQNGVDAIMINEEDHVTSFQDRHSITVEITITDS
jgi:hypothetical protein